MVNIKKKKKLKPENTLIIMIYANYDGVSVNEPTSKTLIIPYNIGKEGERKREKKTKD